MRYKLPHDIEINNRRFEGNQCIEAAYPGKEIRQKSTTNDGRIVRAFRA
jgi:hypothetical protein